MEEQREQPDDPGNNETGVSLTDIEIGRDIDSRSLHDIETEIGHVLGESRPIVNGSSSAYGADDEASTLPGPAQPSPEPRGRRQRRQGGREGGRRGGGEGGQVRPRSPSRHRCRCRCGCEACFCDEPWPAEDWDRTPRAGSPLESFFTSLIDAMDLTSDHVTGDIHGLGIDFMDTMDMDTSHWEIAPTQYHLSARFDRLHTPRRDVPSPDLPAYMPHWRFSDTYQPSPRRSPEFERDEYPHMVFHRHHHQHQHQQRPNSQHYHGSQGDTQNQHRGMTSSAATFLSNNEIVIGQLTRAVSYFLDFLRLLATLIILYGAFRLYFSSIPLNDFGPAAAFS